MIRFTDLTINEALGNFDKVNELMIQDVGSSEWMLKTSATIITDTITTNFILHLWGNGNVFIKDTTHPTITAVPDDDLRELREWCEINGWKIPIVDDRLISDARGFDFWLNKYLAALVDSAILCKYDEDQIKRMSEVEEDKDEEFYIGDGHAH